MVGLDAVGLGEVDAGEVHRVEHVQVEVDVDRGCAVKGGQDLINGGADGEDRYRVLVDPALLLRVGGAYAQVDQPVGGIGHGGPCNHPVDRAGG